MKKVLVLIVFVMAILFCLASCTQQHNFGEWSNIQSPSCELAGKQERSCSCGASETRIVAALGHNYDNELDTICNTCKHEREADAFLLSISSNDIFGYVKGLDATDRELAAVVLYDAINAYTTAVGDHNEYFFNEIPAGTYYLKIEITGYKISSPAKVHITDDGNILQHITVSKVNSSDFFYQWKADDTYFGYEESAKVPSDKTFIFLDETIFVSDSSAASKLQKEYKIILSNEDVSWSADYASRMLELVKSIYNFPKSIPSKWVLTADEINDDVEITYGDESVVVRISKSAFENAIPRKAEYNGLKGTYFSNRLYHALIRYATKEGTDINYIDRLLQQKYGCSIIVPDYSILTADTTQETRDAFEQFKPEELLAILEMFAEMPQGFYKVPNLKYLVRRVDGTNNPLYPSAAAVSWVYVENGYIEFTDDAFLSSKVEDTFRLILQEKAHFLWAYVFSDELKIKWTELGGWYETSSDPDGWATTKETEFVSAYAHAKNPSEDFAESIAYYILMPNKLESRSPEKYAFIRDYIMNGEIYITQIREDLTFEVYNLYPDYKHPGKIIGVDVQVSGAPEENKKVTVTITLDTKGDPTFGASSGFMRIYSDTGTYYDLHLHAVDASKAVLRGSITISQYSSSGFWYCKNIELTDDTGNQRFTGVDGFGWKLYIDNPLADYERPQLDTNSIRVEQEQGILDGRPVTYVHVKFKASDNNEIGAVYCDIANDTHNSYRISEYGKFDNKTGEAVITFIFTEYTQSGEYSIRYIMLKDRAKNKAEYNFLFNSDREPVTFTYESTTSDYTAPTLDVNRITVSATPTHPENPTGETLVHIQYYVKDDASGLGEVTFRLLDPLGKSYSDYHYHENFYTVFFQGDPTAWTQYDIYVLLPEGSAPGKWGLLEMHISDKANNSITYNFLEIIHFQTFSNK